MWTMISKLLIRIRCACWSEPGRSEGGQATAEYALVLLAAATLALLLISWADRSGKIGTLFDAVFDHVIGKVT